MKPKNQGLLATMWSLGTPLLAGLALSACGGGGAGDADGGANPTGDGGESANQAGGEPSKQQITLYTWEDYFDPELLAQFESETGISVVYEVFGSTDEMEAMLKSYPGKYDVVVADDFVLSRLNKLERLQKLDHNLLPNLKNIADKYRQLPFDKGNQFSIPYVWGTTLVAYRADQVENPRQSWNLLWDENLKGKVMMVEESFEPFALALLSLGIRPNTHDAGDYEKAVARLVDQVVRVDVQYGDDTDVKEGLLSGDVWAAMCYSGDAGLVADEDENIDFFIPEEGAPLWIDNFALTTHSERATEVHTFINFMLDAEAAAASSNYTWCATANEAALPLIDDELKGDERIFPTPEVEARCVFLDPADPVREKLINAGWASVQRDLRDLGRREGSSKGSAEAEQVTE